MLYTNNRGLTVLSVGAYEKILFSCIVCEVLDSLARRASVGRHFAYRGDFPFNAHMPRHDFIGPFDIGVPENCSSMKTSGCFGKRRQQSEQASTVTYILARHHDVGLTDPGMFLLVPKLDNHIVD
jgi:hypothetical protein